MILGVRLEPSGQQTFEGSLMSLWLLFSYIIPAGQKTVIDRLINGISRLINGIYWLINGMNRLLMALVG